MKAYSANCYGAIAKASIKAKLEWVDKNLADIINYDNRILLKKATDKLLFLSFCIEFKRFYDFYLNENVVEFHTYLPIQLDATCIGFQHMALLSNEDILFKELNLIYNCVKGKKISDVPPSDFYSFLLHRLLSYFNYKISRGEISDNKNKGSYERLNNFIWSRTNVKKSIMTMPYNSSARAMKNI